VIEYICLHGTECSFWATFKLGAVSKFLVSIPVTQQQFIGNVKKLVSYTQKQWGQDKLADTGPIYPTIF